MPAETTGYAKRLARSSTSGVTAYTPPWSNSASSSQPQQDDASVLLAALEGALILSRANQSTQPLDTVQRFFTTSLTQAAANPAAPAP